MNTDSLAELLKSAENSSHLLVEQHGSLRAAFEELSAELNATKKENSSLAKTIQMLKSENRALHIVRDKLIAERASDKKIIQLWTNRLNADCTQPEGSTQDNVASDAIFPSSPPKIGKEIVEYDRLETANESLSQRLLPTSLGIGDVDNIDVTPFEMKQEFESSKNELHKETALELARPTANWYQKASGNEDLLAAPLSMHSEAQKTGNTSEYNETKHLKRDHSESSNLDYHAWLENLLNRDWHPADFKLDPNQDAGNGLGVERYKQRRKYLHGTGCSNCSKFYDVAGIDEAMQQGSKHRVMLDKQQTPPGYWDMDFPSSSQQIAQNLTMHEHLVTEGRKRLLEAVNGGRYVFKDSELNLQKSRYSAN